MKMRERAAGPHDPDEPIRFVFDEEKATAVASYILELSGGELDLYNLLKLMYYADRQALEDLDRPITGDRMSNLPKGPILSKTYNVIKGEYPLDAWNRIIKRVGKNGLKLEAKVDLSSLSRAEISVIKRTFDQHGRKSGLRLWWDSHRLKEFKDPRQSSSDVSVRELLEQMGKSDDDIRRIAHDAAEERFFHSVFGR